MSNDSGKKPREYTVFGGECNGFPTLLCDGPIPKINERILVREVTPCANCERLESGNKMMRSALETIFNRRMSMYLKYEDMIEDQIKSADECLKAIAKE